MKKLSLILMTTIFISILSVSVLAACTDTDGGLDEFTKGTATDGKKTYVDKCRDGNLAEAFCSNGRARYKTIKCDSNCFDGVCVQTEIIKNDNGSQPPEKWFSLYNGDDRALKQFQITANLSEFQDARLWVLGRKRFCDLNGGGAQYYQVNPTYQRINDGKRTRTIRILNEYEYYPCDLFNENEDGWKWKTLDVDINHLKTGTNKISFLDKDVWTKWKSKNWQIGIDPDATGNDIITRDSQSLSGQLMVRLELCNPECTGTRYPK